MELYQVKPVGKVQINEQGTFIRLEPKYTPALRALDGFGYLNVLWWFSDCDSSEARSRLDMPAPYRGAPDTMGVFATRSPMRPNPLALTAVQVLRIDGEKGLIQIAFIDARNGTPVLDVKPYTPSLDRVENPTVPAWCAHWPKNVETSGDFDWESVFRI